MKTNLALEQKIDSMLIDKDNQCFKKEVRTDSLSEEEREYLYKKAAIGMAHDLYRNGKIEYYHADSCNEATIPDSVMKVINKDVCNKCYQLIVTTGSMDEYISFMIMRSYLTSKLYGSDWDEPNVNALTLSVLRTEALKIYEEEGLEVGAELLVTNNSTQETTLAFITFSSDIDLVVVEGIDDENFDECPLSFAEIQDIFSNYYTIHSYSLEEI